MASPAQQNPPPVKFAAALFPGFQALDLFGPLDTLNLIGRQDHAMSLYVLHSDLSPVSTMLPPSPSAGPRGRASKSAGLDSPMSQSVQPTHTYDTCPDDVEVLIVPGGYGCHDPAAVEHVAAFIRDRMPRLRFLLTICTGSAVAAQAGVLEGRRATCNKRAMDWVIPRHPSVDWVKRARWVVDGKLYTASGVSAGMDMMFGFVADQYGADLANRTADQQEYTRSMDPDNDPFAKD